MSIVPGTSEWDFSHLPPVRHAYLMSAYSFETIVREFIAELRVLEGFIRPSENTHEGARQAIFRVKTNSQAYDLLYNAPDGLRGRYWQSPDLGFAATRYLIDLLKPTLLEFAHANPLQLESNKRGSAKMHLTDVQISLEATSAKVWVRERDNAGNLIIAGGPELVVERWQTNESDPRGKGRAWRYTPSDGEVEIKGALIDTQNQEHIPISKRDRSCQIHHYGFS